MPLHKSIQPGDVLLKLKVPVAEYPLLKSLHAFKDFTLQTLFDNNSNAGYFTSVAHGNAQNAIRSASNLINIVRSQKSEVMKNQQFEHQQKNIERNYSPAFFERSKEYLEDPSLLFADVHTRQHSGEYLHFFVVINSRRSRTRGEHFPTFFMPFFDKLGVKYLTHENVPFQYNYLHAHAFNILNPGMNVETRHKSREVVTHHRNFASYFSYPLRVLDMTMLNSFLSSSMKKPFIDSYVQTLLAPGLSIHLVEPEIYETIPANEFAEQALEDMPDSFKTAFNFIQNSNYNIQAETELLHRLLRARIARQGRGTFFNGSYYNIPDNIHLKDEEVRRDALVNLSKYHIYHYQHNVRFIHPLFNAMSYPLYVLTQLQSIPKNSLPAIELTFH